jgi:hypothetical protein
MIEQKRRLQKLAEELEVEMAKAGNLESWKVFRRLTSIRRQRIIVDEMTIIMDELDAGNTG